MKVLLLLSIYSTLSLADIDWTRLDMEMSYLENTEISTQSIEQSKSIESKPRLARKAQAENQAPETISEIPNLDTVFDSVKSSQAALSKNTTDQKNSYEAQDPREEIHQPTKKSIPATGEVPKDIFESLVD